MYEIGRGGCSIVYALDSSTAKKKISARKMGVVSPLEGYICKHISHPGLVSAISVDIEDGQLAITQDRAVSSVTTLPVKKEWLWKVVAGISTLHGLGIVHGDIKKSNLLLYKDSTVKLGDYSLSTLIPDAKLGTKDCPGMTSYTNHYRAPEVLDHVNWSYPADMWALGCTVYELSACERYPSSKRIKDELLYDLTCSLLQDKVEDRITIWDTLNHPYFNGVSDKVQYNSFASYDLSEETYCEYLYVKNGRVNLRSAETLAQKILHRYSSFKYTNYQAQQEIKMCKNLNYDFLPPS